MKFRFLCLLTFVIPALPYFMLTAESYRCSILINLLLFFLIFSSFVFFFFIKKGEPVNKRIKQIGILTLLSLFTYSKTDNVIEFWQMRRLEKIIESNNLYEKNLSQLPDELKNHNADSRLFLINYSEFFPKHNQSLARIFYRKDLLFENWDCHLYYSKENPSIAPYKIIRSGKNGYNWYKWCNY